jgi:hypothetical protein
MHPSGVSPPPATWATGRMWIKWTGPVLGVTPRVSICIPHKRSVEKAGERRATLERDGSARAIGCTTCASGQWDGNLGLVPIILLLRSNPRPRV